MNPEIPDLIRIELDNPRKPSPDEAVETVLDFVRQWASFDFPRLLFALDRIQRNVFQSIGKPHGDYMVYAAMIEGLMMPSPLAARDEYGIPLQTARKLEPALQPQGDLDAVLERLRNLEPEAIELHPFERELLSDAQRHL